MMSRNDPHGQITVPVESRKVSSLREGDKIASLLENGEVRPRRAGSVVTQTAGILPSASAPLTGEELRMEAEEAIAQDVVRRMS